MPDELTQAIEDAMRDVEGGWCTSSVRCTQCGMKWEAVHPEETPIPALECLLCHLQGYAVLQSLEEPA